MQSSLSFFICLKTSKRSLKSYLLLGWSWPLQWGDGEGRGEGREGEGGEKLTFQAFLEHKDGIQVWKRELFPRGLQIPAASSNIIVNYSHTHTRTNRLNQKEFIMETQSESSLYTKQMLSSSTVTSHDFQLFSPTFLHVHISNLVLKLINVCTAWINSTLATTHQLLNSREHIFCGLKKEKLTTEMTGKEAEDNTEQHQQLHVALLNEENAHQCRSLFVFLSMLQKWNLLNNK